MSHPIYPYQPPRALAANLWQVEGSLPFPLPRNMTIYRTPAGELVLYSVIAMHEEGMRALEALGRPTVLVIAHDRHHMDALFYKTRYPSLRVVAPPDARPIDGLAYEAGLEVLAEYGIKAYVLPGNTYHDVVLELPLADGTALCVCESLGQSENLSGILALLLRVIGPPGGGFGVARAVKWREIRDRDALAMWLRVHAPQTKMVLTGHGPPLLHDVQQKLEHAAARV